MAMSRLPGLDVLRAAAILAVLGTHAWVAGSMGPGFDWLVETA
jgi:peptidoglycan/LPS O-acetylase OafA/YrhL